MSNLNFTNEGLIPEGGFPANNFSIPYPKDLPQLINEIYKKGDKKSIIGEFIDKTTFIRPRTEETKKKEIIKARGIFIQKIINARENFILLIAREYVTKEKSAKFLMAKNDIFTSILSGNALMEHIDKEFPLKDEKGKNINKQIKDINDKIEKIENKINKEKNNEKKAKLELEKIKLNQKKTSLEVLTKNNTNNINTSTSSGEKTINTKRKLMLEVYDEVKRLFEKKELEKRYNVEKEKILDRINDFNKLALEKHDIQNNIIKKKLNFKYNYNIIIKEITTLLNQIQPNEAYQLFENKLKSKGTSAEKITKDLELAFNLNDNLMNTYEKISKADRSYIAGKYKNINSLINSVKENKNEIKNFIEYFPKIVDAIKYGGVYQTKIGDFKIAKKQFLLELNTLANKLFKGFPNNMKNIKFDKCKIALNSLLDNYYLVNDTITTHVPDNNDILNTNNPNALYLELVGTDGKLKAIKSITEKVQELHKMTKNKLINASPSRIMSLVEALLKNNPKLAFLAGLGTGLGIGPILFLISTIWDSILIYSKEVKLHEDLIKTLNK